MITTDNVTLSIVGDNIWFLVVFTMIKDLDVTSNNNKDFIVFRVN
jgi:hypothetical protein